MSVVLTIVVSGGGFVWQASTAVSNIDRNFSDLRKDMSNIAQQLERLTSEKVSARDLQIFCLQAQLHNKQWKCPMLEVSTAALPPAPPSIPPAPKRKPSGSLFGD
jgi:hypothetical protein